VILDSFHASVSTRSVTLTTVTAKHHISPSPTHTRLLFESIPSHSVDMTAYWRTGVSVGSAVNSTPDSRRNCFGHFDLRHLTPASGRIRLPPILWTRDLLWLLLPTDTSFVCRPLADRRHAAIGTECRLYGVVAIFMSPHDRSEQPRAAAGFRLQW